MPSTSHVVLAAIVALVVWTAIGKVVLHRVVAPDLVWPFAPIVGWAVHGAIALPLFFVVPFATPTIVIVALATHALAMIATRASAVAPGDRGHACVPRGAVVLAAVLAACVAAAILPKHAGDAVVLADPIFDHSKVAIVADIARLGLPAGNPFLAGDDGAGRLAYYYLLHFSAAELVRVLGVTGWEADAAMTFFAAFASLAVAMGLAVRFARRAQAAWWVSLFALTSSLRPIAIALFGAGAVDAWTEPPNGFAGWLFQSSWVPQHLASATCVVVAVYLMSALTGRGDAARTGVIALVVAAAFESSTWVGGVVFAVATLVVVPVIVRLKAREDRPRVIAALAIAGLVAIVVAWPFLRDQLASSARRQSASPIAITPYPVLGDAVPEAVRRVLDVPAFWLVLLPMELSAAYVVGLFAMRRVLRDAEDEGDRDARPAIAAFVALTLASLACSGLLASTFAVNNDLGWRAALLASLALVVFSAAGLARWIRTRRRVAVVLSCMALALGLPEAYRLIDGKFAGVARPGGREFADAPALWTRVRDLTAPDERVASNPLALARLTAWPVNVGWALLADRRSCYAAWELDQVFTSVPHDRLHAINDRFERIFAGEASRSDLDDLANLRDCRAIVLTPADGAWARDPFRDDARYALVDERAARWRIYRRRGV